MATRKNNNTEVVETVADDIEAVQEPAIDVNKEVEIFIPKGNVNDDPNLFVSVNGKAFLLPRGKTSKVPQYIYDEIIRSRKAEEVMDQHISERTQAAGN